MIQVTEKKQASPEKDANTPSAGALPPTFQEATRTWAYIGMNSFGGPAGQIAVMHRVLVEEKRWVSEERFLHALNYCMLLPGPEAQQLATYIGWLLHGARGGLVAGTLFILPGVLVIMVLSYLYAGFQQVTAIQALFFGLKSAVLAIVAEAVLRIGKRALKTRFSVGVAASAFVAIFFLGVPFPAIVVGAALLGPAKRYHEARNSGAALAHPDPYSPTLVQRPSLARSLRVLAVWLSLWLVPLVFLLAARGAEDTYFQVGSFFSKAAVVTFGGAYSVLAYIAQQAVETFGWLRPGEMLDGLAMAETTPGPLIMVVQFVGFMAAFRNPGALPPLAAGTLGGLLTTWVTFAPCFLWIFLGAPYIEALRGNKALNASLGAITAAVVGVVLNLAVWFFLHTVFAKVSGMAFGPLTLQIPDLKTLNWAALLVSCGAMVATFRYQVSMFKLLAVCALSGVAIKAVSL
ncbi:MAG: chromate efflux transporter [Candidatus Hydrogenedentes bacterium]|nr:chromate efflux transporter [Candidatus Hydrogenedentota bacterium]MBI3119225.1 chromate efflux transporter [Candidatus Hydrogenedentota bacterium]